MKEYLQSVNACAERMYYQTRGKYTMSLEELVVLQEEINSMLKDIEEAKKESIRLYEEKRG